MHHLCIREKFSVVSVDRLKCVRGKAFYQMDWAMHLCLKYQIYFLVLMRL